jgi:hypothetical protein
VRSPGRPEFGQHRAGIRADEIIEGSIAELQRPGVKRRQGLLAMTATSLQTFLINCYSVSLPAGGASDNMGFIAHFFLLPYKQSEQNWNWPGGKEKLFSPDILYKNYLTSHPEGFLCNNAMLCCPR